MVKVSGLYLTRTLSYSPMKVDVCGRPLFANPVTYMSPSHLLARLQTFVRYGHWQVPDHLNKWGSAVHSFYNSILTVYYSEHLYCHTAISLQTLFHCILAFWLHIHICRHVYSVMKIWSCRGLLSHLKLICLCWHFLQMRTLSILLSNFLQKSKKWLKLLVVILIFYKMHAWKKPYHLKLHFRWS